MNTVAYDWAWDQQLWPKAKFVLMALAFSADDHGVCCPSVQMLASMCSLSPRTVQRIIRELIAGGLLQTQERFSSDDPCTANHYVLMIDGGDKLSEAPVTCDRSL